MDSMLGLLQLLHDPLKMKHLELFLKRWMPSTSSDCSPMSSDSLDFVLDLCQNGSLQKFTLTASEGNPREATVLGDKLSKLETLGVLDLRVGYPSQLLPGCSHSYCI